MAFVAGINLWAFAMIVVLVFTGLMRKNQTLAYFAAILSITFAILSVILSIHVLGVGPNVEVSWT